MSRILSISFVWLFSALLVACAAGVAAPADQADMPNPASVHCEQSGGRLVLVQDASGGTRGDCVLPDGTVCEEWAYYRGECVPGSEEPTAATPTAAAPDAPPSEPRPSATPESPPIAAADYQGWWPYTNDEFGFMLQLPPDWVADESTAAGPLPMPPVLELHPTAGAQPLSLRVSFRRAGEEGLLWPTGAGEGEFVPQGILYIDDRPVRRIFLVCPSGQTAAVYYQGEEDANVALGDLQLSFLYRFRDAHCAEGHDMDGKTVRVADMIVASLRQP